MNSEQIGDMQADAEGAPSRWPAEIEAPGATGAVSRPDIQARMGEIQN
jgi:hypothetical protein